MSSIMEEIYYGRVFPEEQIVPDSEEYWNKNRRVSDIITEFTEKLDKEDAEKIKEIYDLMTDIQDIMCLESYKTGFSAGLLLMKEAQEKR